MAVVPPAFTCPFHVAVKDGAEEAAQELGWQVEAVAAQKENDFAGQVAALGINPIDSQAIVHAVKEANDAHIPVFMQSLITPSAPLQ